MTRMLASVCTIKEAQIVYDINRHTIRAMQTSFNLHKWQPISFRNLFDVEYWELEQAKLKKDIQPPEFQGKIALITGAASGIGYACAKTLLENGCTVVGLDKDRKVLKLFKEYTGFKGFNADLTKTNDVKKAVSS